MQAHKLDPALLTTLQAFDELGAAGLESFKRAYGVVRGTSSGLPASAVVFLQCDATASLAHLARDGVRINPGTGPVRTALVPLVKLSDVSEDDAVKRIVASRFLRPLMDMACPRVHVPAFVARHPTPFDGSGVCIGLVDSGIDAAHVAFAGRIVSVWDQTVPGPGVAEGAYGVELTGAGIASASDTDGHGTHVAGIAAGNHGLYNGVAPGASLVVVKTDFQTAHIVDAIRYVHRVAGARPSVVNLSLGGHWDAHDGSDLLSLAIDTETGPGRLVCCAAGNEGNDNIHGRADVAPSRTHGMRFRVPPAVVGLAALNGWSDSASLEIAVRTPGGFVTPFVGAGSAPAGAGVRHPTPEGRITVSPPRRDPANGDFGFLVEIRGPVAGANVRPGVWQLLVKNTDTDSVRVDVWTLDDQASPQVLFSGKSVSDDMKIGSPGAAASAVTVGSYTTRTDWTDASGALQRVGLVLHDVSDFSSEGPLRNGSAKPDLLAPGAMIVSALSSAARPEPGYTVTPDYQVMAGTSMAAPFVSGLLCLMLQRTPTLDPARAKALLQHNCSWPGTAAGFHAKRGHGLIDAAAL